MYHPLLNYIIALALFSTNLFFPQFGFVLTLFTPILILKYLTDERVTKREHIAAIAMTLALVYFSPLFLVYFIFLSVFPAFVVYWYLVRKGDSKTDIVVIASLPIFIFALLTLFIFVEYKNAIINYMTSYLDMAINGYKNQGGNFEANSYLMYIKNNKDAIAYTMVHLMPALSFVYASLLTVVCRKYYFKKFNFPEIRYKVNDKLVFILIVGGFLILSKNSVFKLISYNTLIIFTALFFYQGLDIMNYYFNKWKLSYFLRLLLYILIFSEPHVIVIVAIFGLFDNWYDMTKISFKRKSG